MTFWLEPDPISGKPVPRAAVQEGGEALADALAEPAAASRNSRDRRRVHLDGVRALDPFTAGAAPCGEPPLERHLHAQAQGMWLEE